jgi:hypothetical protein
MFGRQYRAPWGAKIRANVHWLRILNRFLGTLSTDRLLRQVVLELFDDAPRSAAAHGVAIYGRGNTPFRNSAVVLGGT